MEFLCRRMEWTYSEYFNTRNQVNVAQQSEGYWLNGTWSELGCGHQSFRTSLVLTEWEMVGQESNKTSIHIVYCVKLLSHLTGVWPEKNELSVSHMLEQTGKKLGLSSRARLKKRKMGVGVADNIWRSYWQLEKLLQQLLVMVKNQVRHALSAALVALSNTTNDYKWKAVSLMEQRFWRRIQYIITEQSNQK